MVFLFLVGVGGVFALVVFLLIIWYTVYVAYIHWKYSHIPSPDRSRYVVINN